MNIKIFYEDKDIIVCFKPCGVLSQFSEDRNNMITVLSELTGTDVYPIHRLDKETSGIMVFAKNQNAAAILSKAVSDRMIYKEYTALVHGVLTPQKAEMKDLLYHDRKNNRSYVVKRERKGVKSASLEYEVIEQRLIDNQNYSLVKIILHTGRTHQIRVQFSSRGYSLAGDRRYGGKDNFENLQLVSTRIKFKHPKTNKEFDFSI